MRLTEGIRELKAKFGSETEIGQWFEMTLEWINDFVKDIGSFQWIHLDQKRAEA